MIEEKPVPVITKVGKIWGREAIILQKIDFIDETTVELKGYFIGHCCSELGEGKNFEYKIAFNGINLFKMIELDYDESDYQSSSSVKRN